MNLMYRKHFLLINNQNEIKNKIQSVESKLKQVFEHLSDFKHSFDPTNLNKITNNIKNDNKIDMLEANAQLNDLNKTLKEIKQICKSNYLEPFVLKFEKLYF